LSEGSMGRGVMPFCSEKWVPFSEKDRFSMLGSGSPNAVTSIFKKPLPTIANRKKIMSLYIECGKSM
jgi:hypothetical protein